MSGVVTVGVVAERVRRYRRPVRRRPCVHRRVVDRHLVDDAVVALVRGRLLLVGTDEHFRVGDRQQVARVAVLPHDVIDHQVRGVYGRLVPERQVVCSRK